MILDSLPTLTTTPTTIGFATRPCGVCRRKITVSVTAWVEPDPDDDDCEVFCTDVDLTDLETHQLIHELEDTWDAPAAQRET